MERVEAYEDAERLAMRLIESCQLPVGVAGQRFTITVSIGISMFPHDGTKLADLIHYADRGMYMAKGSGRNRHIWLGHTREPDTTNGAD